MSATIRNAINNEILRLTVERDNLRRATSDVDGVMGSAYQRQLDGLESQIRELQDFLAKG